MTNGASVETARIALAPDGTPHIFYDGPGNEKWYTTPDANGDWTTERVINAADHHISITVDSQGTPHATYSDSSGTTVTHAKRTTTSWQKTTISHCSRNPSISLDANDLAHIACRTPNGDGLGILHAYETTPGTWTWEEAIHGNELIPPRGQDNVGGGGTSIAINPTTGSIHIASRTGYGFSLLQPAQPITPPKPSPAGASTPSTASPSATVTTSASPWTATASPTSRMD